jgi:hypothetical protein
MKPRGSLSWEISGSRRGEDEYLVSKHPVRRMKMTSIWDIAL